MTDIATLGLRVDSSQVATATTALGGLTTAAKTAAPAVAALVSATKPAGAALNVMSNASHAASSAHQGMSTQAMSAFHSIRSMTESIIAGASPTQALALQLNHLSYAASGPQGLKGAFSEAAGMLTKFISPATLVVGAIAGVTVGFGIALAKIVSSEVAFAALSSRVGTTVQSLHALESAAAFKGISTADFTKGMEHFGQLTYEAQHNMGSLAEYFRLTGTQAGTLEQNFSHVGDLIKNAKDDAARYAIIQQLGLPPTAQWVELLKQGSAGIAKAKAEAVQLGGQPMDDLVRKTKEFNEGWNRIVNFIENEGKAAVVDVATGFGQSMSQLWDHFIGSDVEAFKRYQQEVERFVKNMAGIKPGVNLDNDLGQNDIGKKPRNLSADLGINDISKKPTPDLNDEKNRISVEQQRIGVLGQLVSFEEAHLGKLNELRLADLAGVKISKEERDSILETADAEKQGLLAMDTQTDALKAQTNALHLGVGASAAYIAVQTQLNDDERYGRTRTPEMVKELHEYADALGAATQKLAEMKMQSDLTFARSQIGNSSQEQQVASALRQLYGDNYQSHTNDAIANQIRFNDTLTQTKGIAENALSGFVKDLAAGKGGVVALHNAMQSLEQKLIDMATNVLISNMFKMLLGSVGGTPGVTAGNDPFGSSGLFGVHTQHTGGIVGSESGPARSMPMSVFAGAPRFHGGGMANDEVPTVLQKGEGVFTAGQMRALGSGNGSGGTQVIINNHADNSQVQTQTRKERGIDITEVVISTVGKHMANGGFDQALRARTGTIQQPRGR